MSKTFWLKPTKHINKNILVKPNQILAKSNRIIIINSDLIKILFLLEHFVGLIKKNIVFHRLLLNTIKQIFLLHKVKCERIGINQSETHHPFEGHFRPMCPFISSVGAVECGVSIPPVPIIFELTRKLHIPPTPSRRHARQDVLSFFLIVVGGRHDRVRDHRQPPWQQTLPKGRRSSRLGLPGKLQVIAVDCNPGKPHPVLSILSRRKIRRSAWMDAM